MSKWQKGQVQWFDELSGEGMVLDDQGESLYVHWSTIVPKNAKSRSTLNARKNLRPGKKVKFQVYENFYSKRIEKVQEI